MFVLLCLRANSSFWYLCVHVFCPFVFKVLICAKALYVQCPYMFTVLIWVVGECGGARPSVVLSFCGNSLFVHEVSFCYTSGVEQ